MFVSFDVHSIPQVLRQIAEGDRRIVRKRHLGPTMAPESLRLLQDRAGGRVLAAARHYTWCVDSRG